MATHADREHHKKRQDLIRGSRVRLYRSSKSRRSALRAGRRTTRTSFSTTNSTCGRFRPMASTAVRLTNGASDQVRHRLCAARSGRGIHRSRKAAVLELVRNLEQEVRIRAAESYSDDKTERLIWADKSVERLAKAKDADVYAYAIGDIRAIAQRLCCGARPECRRSRSLTPTRFRATTPGAIPS